MGVSNGGKTSLRSAKSKTRAIVIGASMAGLCAANALAPHFDQVMVMERDCLDTVNGARRGVPQGNHVHALLAGGLNHFEAAFPGVTAELVAAGANVGDPSASCRWFQGGGLHARCSTDMRAVVATRPLIERVIRARVAALPQVQFQEGTSVRALLWNADSSRVIGIQTATSGEPMSELVDSRCDLVIDAGGRGSLLPRWLSDAGYDQVPETTLPVGVRYTTRSFARTPAQLPGTIVSITVGDPCSRRGGLAFAVEDDRWQITLAGRGDDIPPADLEGFIAFANSLPMADVADLVQRSTPLDDGVTFHFPVSQRRHYEQMTSFPQGIIPFGDSICGFTPVYGQGMTVAIMEAEVLDRCLGDGSTNVMDSFMHGITDVIDGAWELASSGDLPFLMERSTMPRKVRFVTWYLAHVHRAARSNANVARAFTNVVHMTAPASSLMAPGIAGRVFTEYLRARPVSPESRRVSSETSASVT